MIKCNIPNTDKPENQIIRCLEIIKEIESSKDDLTKIDLSLLSWISPFSVLILGSKISEIRKYKEIKIIPPKNPNVKSFLSKVGFPLGKDKGDSTYCPLLHFSKDVQKAIDHLYKVIDDAFPKIVENQIKLIIAELCDNVDQHSNFTNASVIAQYHPQKRFVDLGVYDNGLGIPEVYSKKGISYKDNIEALSFAIQGISTKKEKGRGKGLITTRRLVNEGFKGDFFILSANSGIKVKNNNCHKFFKFQNNILKGTLVYCRFYITNTPINYLNYVN